MSQAHSEAKEAGSALSERGFWGIFVAAWLAYLALFVTATRGEEGMTGSSSLVMALANTLPPAALSVVVALRRRDLLRPERTLSRTVLVHVGVGLLFAVTGAAAVMAVLALVGWSEPRPPGTGTAAVFGYHVVSGVFLYTILAGFLMWAESLRRVHESRSFAVREAMLRAQAEAKVLRAQFNPHFVFNTLHSLMLLVRADPAAAERAIEDVATVIRYASVLQRQEVDLVPLAKELEVARRYVKLERMRLEDRLRVEWDVEVDSGAVAVPAFALQTLLENAIKHGLEPRAKGGTVRIGARIGGASLVLSVSDDGSGADPCQVAAAQGHGLELLERRLRSLFGDAAGVEWTTAPEQGFSVLARIPVKAPPPLVLPSHGPGDEQS